jgi:hypothetical protein
MRRGEQTAERFSGTGKRQAINRLTFHFRNYAIACKIFRRLITNSLLGYAGRGRSGCWGASTKREARGKKIKLRSRKRFLLLLKLGRGVGAALKAKKGMQPLEPRWGGRGLFPSPAIASEGN